LPKEILGVTLFNGQLFINRKYYDMPYFYIKQKNAIILTILIHELAHILRRILIDGNFFNSTKEFTKFSIRFLDLGDYLDYLLYGKFEIMHEPDAVYILQENSWEGKYGFEQFKKDFIKNKRAIPQNQKRNGFLLKQIGDNIGFGGVSRRGFCGFALMRNKNFN